jgi:sugar transferase (PEP-CTERM/EpsH1 system associated)
MNILFLTSRFPYPPYRGDKLKIYNLIKQLAHRGHSVSLLSFVGSAQEEEYVPVLKKFCANIRTVRRPLLKSIGTCVTGISSDIPFQIHFFSDDKFQRELKDVLTSWNVNLIHVHLIRMAQYVESLRTVPRILDLTDAGSLYLERFLSITKNPFKKIFLKVESRRLRQYEKILEHFDDNLVCSEIDRAVLNERAPSAAIDLLYNGVDLDYFTKPGETDGANVGEPNINGIIYTGNMTYHPNRDGILYFVKEIFPTIERVIPTATLYIVGQSPPREIKKLSRANIVVRGFVPDIKQEYLKNQVAIAPIRFGAGTLNKVLEPMALGIPVVSTSLAVQGLNLQNGEEIMVADTPEGFADMVVRILRDKEFQQRIGLKGQAIVRGQYGWTTITSTLEKIYQSLQLKVIE